MVMDAIIRVIPSDPVMAHAAEVGVVFLWSRSSALTSPPTTQVQQMLNDLVDSEGSTSGDSSSSEEVFVISTIFSSRNDVQGLLRAELQDYLDDLNHQMIWIHQVIFLWSR